MLHAVIMAGGSGTRFWPASRQMLPKQLLKMAGSQTMLQETFARLANLVSPEHVLILTNSQLTNAIATQIPGLPPEHIVGEPCKRDTAPCIGIAASLIASGDPDGAMLVMPSDHVIEPREEFHRTVRAGLALIDEDPSRIVTFGIRPNYPAESFGYIQRGAGLTSIEGTSAFQVAKFREKPDRATAQSYVDSGDFYWNSGIFLWRASTILQAIKANEPEMFQHIDNIAKSIGSSDFSSRFEQEYAAIRGKSIDFAVMESYPNVAVVETTFRWDDVGSWQAMARLLPPDEHGNTVEGPYLPIDSSGMIVRTNEDHLVVTIGTKDMIVVHTSDATLVAPKSQEERVREVVQQLSELGHLRYL